MSDGGALQIFVASAVLIGLALIATSKTLYRLRRSRPVVVLLSGGWLAVLVGVLLGPSGVGVVGGDIVREIRPLLAFGLGWIGLMIGLQARREVLAPLPAAVLRLAFADAGLSLVLFGVVAVLGMRVMLGVDAWGWYVVPVAVIACGSVGWSMETRSLRVSDAAPAQRLALLVRATGGLGALLAVGAFGVLGEAVSRGEDGLPMFAASQAGLKLAACAGLAVAIGLLGRFGLRMSGRSQADQLAVFLGIVAFVAGLSDQFGLSTLFTAALTGVVIANLTPADTARFQRFILNAEHVVAALFGLLAGALLSPAIGAVGVGLAIACAVLRRLVKPAVFRVGVGAGRARRAAGPAGPLELPARSPLYAGPARQSPLAPALAVGAWLMEPSEMNERLLAIVVLAGLLSDAIPLALSALTERDRRVIRGLEERGGTP